MSKPSERTVGAYRTMLEQIKGRLDNAGTALGRSRDRFGVEVGALNLRFALEGVLLSSLVTHEHELGEITKAIRKADASKAQKRVAAINGRWWPEPIAVTEIPDPKAPRGRRFEFAPVEDGFMAEGEWGRAYGVVSDLLHTRNPFRSPPKGPHQLHGQLLGFHGSLVRLLDHHIIHPADRDYMLAGQMATGPSGDVSVTLFGAIDPPF